MLRAKYPAAPMELVRPLLTPVTSMSSFQRATGKEDFKSFIITRNPFHRLVSAFRDKIERFHGKDYDKRLTDWYYTKYGKGMVKAWRSKATEKFGSSFFAEANNYGAPVPVKDNRRDPRWPIFWEFVQTVKTSSPIRMDEHWRPMTANCPVCLLPFEAFVKFENLEKEGPLLKQWLDPKPGTGIRWDNNNKTPGMSDEELTLKYFEQLNEEDVKALYKVYEQDFMVFGYQFKWGNLTLGAVNGMRRL